MSREWSGPWSRRRPPVPVVKAAERAIREQRASRIGQCRDSYQLAVKPVDGSSA